MQQIFQVEKYLFSLSLLFRRLRQFWDLEVVPGVKPSIFGIKDTKIIDMPYLISSQIGLRPLNILFLFEIPENIKIHSENRIIIVYQD